MKILILLIAGCLFFCGCSFNKNNGTHYYNHSVSGKDLKSILEEDKYATITYPWIEQSAFSRVITSAELEENGLITAMKYNNGKYYSVSYLGQDSYLFLLYNENNDFEKNLYVVDGFLVNAPLINRDVFFKTAKIGASKNDILKCDLNGFDADDCTYHRFDDKSMVYIEYDAESNYQTVKKVTDIDTSLSVLNFLLPEDFDLVI